MEKQFNPDKYTEKYYKRHFDQYRTWENLIGKHIYDIFKPSSIVDLGCGVGSYLEGAFQNGCKDICGIEISYEKAQKYIVDVIKPFIACGDITKSLNLDRQFDCVVSFEVGEHIEPDGTDAFIDNLTNLCKQYIILTAAPPGQPGTGHINRREKKFWIKSIQTKKFIYQDQIVNMLWPVWKTFSTPKYILKNLMVFKKR